MKYFYVRCDSNYASISDDKIIKHENMTDDDVLAYMDDWWREESEDEYGAYVMVQEIEEERYIFLRDEEWIPVMEI